MPITRRDLWRKLQKQEWDKYQESPKGVFSIKGHKFAERLKNVLSREANSPILDIGCGCLPKPAYMCDGLEWYGIDPFKGDKKRQFKFKKGVAENIPYEEEAFASVLFATSLDHVVNPVKAIQEAARVLQQSGKLFIWYSRRGGKAYEIWKAQKGPALYNKHHMWAWGDADMIELVRPWFFIDKLYKWGTKNRVLIGVKE